MLFNTPLRLYLARQGSSVWSKLRENRLTSSDYAAALGVRGAYRSRYRLAVEKFYDPKSRRKPNAFVEEAMKHGKVMEKHAFAAFNDHQNKYLAVNCGFLCDFHNTRLGATPDGLVYSRDGKDLLGALEIKCPFSRQPYEHVCEIKGQYMMQMMGQVMCLPAWCNTSFFFDYASDNNYRLHVIEFDLQRQHTMREKLLEFLDMIDEHNEDTFPKRISKCMDV